MAESSRIEELERLLREAQLLNEAERQRAETERQRAETERQRADAAEEQLRPTTLDECIEAYHSLIFSNFRVETNKSLTSKGSITNPRNKYCPTSLQVWPDFLTQQRRASGVLYEYFPTKDRLFQSRSGIFGMAASITRRPIANEKALENFLHGSVETPVADILGHLLGLDKFKAAYEVGGSIIFENHPSAVSDSAEEVVNRRSISVPSTPNQRRRSDQLRPDQICVYHSSEDDQSARRMIYVCEYKAPHKLKPEHLRAGLRPMEVFKDVVNRQTIPTSADPEGRFQYHAERLSSAAVSQTYHYMIEGGLDFGLLTTGEAIVFLKLDWDNPQTLYYHLAEPGPEVSSNPQQSIFCTAVSQYLAFTLMALNQGQQHDQHQRRLVTRELKTWTEEFEVVLRSIPAEERVPPSDSSYQPSPYDEFDRSPIPFRHPRRETYCKGQANIQPTKSDSSGSSDDESERNLPGTPSPAERRAGGGPRRSQRIQARQTKGAQSSGHKKHSIQYCSQKCLIGLVEGGFLDNGCPNVTLHNRHAAATGFSVRHPVGHAEWLQLLRKQLERSLDDGVTALGDGGSRGVLFRIVMLAYGYTFIAKGTVRVFIEDLEHEAAIYRRLKAAQGVSIPVFLGTFDLRTTDQIYYYDHRVYIVYMMFLSWGGYKLHDARVAASLGKELADGTLQSLRSMHAQGVVHRDIREANMLFNPETKRVMIIDFERATLVQPARRVLAQTVPNKRTNGHEASGKVSKRVEDWGSFGEDLAMVEYTFGELEKERKTPIRV